MAAPHDILPLAEQHLPAIAVLEAQLFERPTDEAALKRLFANPAFAGHVLCVVAADAPVVAGYILALNAGYSADLVSIGTAPAWQGSGFGRSLVTHLAAALHRCGTKELMLEVARDNAPARRLYDAAGFCDVAVRHGYYQRAGGAVDALVMRLQTHHAVP